MLFSAQIVSHISHTDTDDHPYAFAYGWLNYPSDWNPSDRLCIGMVCRQCDDVRGFLNCPCAQTIYRRVRIWTVAHLQWREKFKGSKVLGFYFWWMLWKWLLFGHKMSFFSYQLKLDYSVHQKLDFFSRKNVFIKYTIRPIKCLHWHQIKQNYN